MSLFKITFLQRGKREIVRQFNREPLKRHCQVQLTL